jgi:hypothetical protein
MSDTVKKYRSLIDVLYEKTTKKSIKWRYEASDRSVWVKLAGQIIVLTGSSNSDFEPLCNLVITNSDGDLLEGFSDENLRGDQPKTALFSDWYSFMTALFEMAKRQATGADEALDNILKELGQDDDLDDDVEF